MVDRLIHESSSREAEHRRELDAHFDQLVAALEHRSVSDLYCFWVYQLWKLLAVKFLQNYTRLYYLLLRHVCCLLLWRSYTSVWIVKFFADCLMILWCKNFCVYDSVETQYTVVFNNSGITCLYHFICHCAYVT